MAIRVRTVQGRALTLGDRVGAGGGGVVYEVRDSPGLVAKLLLRADDLAASHRRLASLVRQGRSPRTAALRAGRPQRAAWPIATISTAPAAGREFGGFLMPDMRKQFIPLDCLVTAGLRQRHLPSATWATSLTAAGRLARLVADLHAAGYVAGDLKPENLWVDAQGNVGISDVDSFQFDDGQEIFAGGSHSPAYSPPEAIDVHRPEFDDASDDFILAILIHQILMVGMHPFHGQPANGQPYVSLDDNLLRGRCRLLRPDAVIVPRHAPPVSVLPRGLQQLFRSCFGEAGRSDRSVRPTAAQWLAGIEAAIAGDRLRQCGEVPSHIYTAERPWCPWCEHARRSYDWYPAPHPAAAVDFRESLA